MRTEIQNIPGITKIGWLKSEFLPKRIDLKCIVGEMITIFTDIHWLDFCGAPECVLKKQKENHAYSEEVELSFLSPVNMPKYDVAVVVESANGERFIIGSREEPKADVSVERNLGLPDGAPSAFSIKVIHKALRTLVPCE